MGITEEEVELTLHALEQMQERGISVDDVLHALQRGARVRQTDGFLVMYAGIGVAYRKTKAGKYRVKTVMWL